MVISYKKVNEKLVKTLDEGNLLKFKVTEIISPKDLFIISPFLTIILSFIGMYYSSRIDSKWFGVTGLFLNCTILVIILFFLEAFIEFVGCC